jgi:uncharacterized membrane protein YgaE (UPF0421/DUF939 family)
MARPSLLERVRARRDRVSQLLGAQASGRIGPSFALRTTAAVLLATLLCHLLHLSNPIWAQVSAVVVIMPTHAASVTSAALRVISNLVGAGVGVALAQLQLPSLVTIALGLIVVAGLCRLLAIDAAARSASVALVIVSLRGADGIVGSSELRLLLVLLGCASALAVTIVAAGIERALARRRPR